MSLSYSPMDNKIIHPHLRDPVRTYSGTLNQELIAESGGRCSHPMCDYSYLSLKAHHIIQHARGGLTVKPNGLMLCAKCHRILHDGFVPQRLAFLIKYWIVSGRNEPLVIGKITVEELINQVEKIKMDQNLTANEKFTQLNDILITANFLPSRNARYLVFINVCAAKVSTLNDGVSPLRSSLGSMLISMDFRRKWAQMLASIAKRYADEINHHWLGLYFIHSRAVGFNARNRFKRAVNEFNKALKFMETIPKQKSSQVQQLKSRLIREMAVCRAKETQNSKKAKREVLTSLDMAHALGETHNINDALVRCVEGMIFLGEFQKTSFYLDKLYANWPKLDNHLKAITMKMDVRLALAENRKDYAEEMIEKGMELSKKYNFHHQMYHFTRLDWNMKIKFQDKRQRLIT